jgi:hypothetical protein
MRVKAASGREADLLPPRPTKRSASHVTEALEFQGGQPPIRSSWTGSECPNNATAAVPKRAQVPKMRLQRLASRRLMPIKAANEVIKRMAARVNLSTGTGGKAGAATSV